MQAEVPRQRIDRFQELGLVKGSFTKRLSKIVPIELLKILINFYVLIKQIEQSYVKAVPVHEVKKIIAKLKNLFRKSFLTEKEFQNLSESLWNEVWKSKEFTNAKRSEVKRALQVIDGKRKNNALDVLIFGLISELKYRTHKPHYDLVANVLLEQNILDKEVLEGEVLRKRFSRLPTSHMLGKCQICFHWFYDYKTVMNKIFSGFSRGEVPIPILLSFTIGNPPPPKYHSLRPSQLSSELRRVLSIL